MSSSRAAPSRSTSTTSSSLIRSHATTNFLDALSTVKALSEMFPVSDTTRQCIAHHLHAEGADSGTRRHESSGGDDKDAPDSHSAAFDVDTGDGAAAPAAKSRRAHLPLLCALENAASNVTIGQGVAHEAMLQAAWLAVTQVLAMPKVAGSGLSAALHALDGAPLVTAICNAIRDLEAWILVCERDLNKMAGTTSNQLLETVNMMNERATALTEAGNAFASEPLCNPSSTSPPPLEVLRQLFVHVTKTPKCATAASTRKVTSATNRSRQLRCDDDDDDDANDNLEDNDDDDDDHDVDDNNANNDDHDANDNNANHEDDNDINVTFETPRPIPRK